MFKLNDNRIAPSSMTIVFVEFTLCDEIISSDKLKIFETTIFLDDSMINAD